MRSINRVSRFESPNSITEKILSFGRQVWRFRALTSRYDVSPMKKHKTTPTLRFLSFRYFSESFSISFDPRFIFQKERYILRTKKYVLFYLLKTEKHGRNNGKTKKQHKICKTKKR